LRLQDDNVADSTRSIAIIGAGFCGTVTAVNLLRLAHAEPLRILLIDRERHGRGTAYAAHASSHLLNVPAGRMSARSVEPLDFLRFAQRTAPQVTAEDFLPRSLYGDYLEEMLLAAERSAPAHVRLERISGEVRSLDIWRPSHTYILGFKDGRELTATEVVLALGNPPPARLRATDALRASRRVIDDPWCGQQAILPGETVLVVGTGLTMADVAISALHGQHAAVVHAISRHGLVPPRQTEFRQAHAQFDAQPLLRAASRSVRSLFRQVRRICREAEQRGGDWREAITFVRSLAPKLWSRLSERERRRFLRHARVYWDTHRHRLPPSARATLNAEREAQRLMVHAGQIQKLELEGNQVRVTWRARGQHAPAELRVDRVINCTGPDYRCESSADPLIGALAARGLIQPDTVGTGLRTEPNGGVLNLFGRATRGLYYVGPMLRADHWEATAVPELRVHAENLARHLTLPMITRTLVHGAQ
jgi:uncharacterized NAD(P)/FAD-binding protein YdhS